MKKNALGQSKLFSITILLFHI